MSLGIRGTSGVPPSGASPRGHPRSPLWCGAPSPPGLGFIQGGTPVLQHRLLPLWPQRDSRGTRSQPGFLQCVGRRPRTGQPQSPGCN